MFNGAVASIKTLMEKLNTFIIKSNAEYERRMKESRSTGRKGGGEGGSKPLISRLESDNLKVIHQRQHNFDRFLKFVLVVLSSTIAEMAVNNNGSATQRLR